MQKKRFKAGDGFKGKIVPTSANVYLRKHHKLSFRGIAGECGLLKATVARLCICNNNSVCTGRSVKPERKGRPRKISVRSMRKRLRALKTLSSLNQNITVEKVMTRSGFKTSTLQVELKNIFKML